MTHDIRPRQHADDADAGEAWLDAWLRGDAARSPYVGDAGFTAALMAKLPAQATHARYRWIVPTMGVLGFLIGLGFLSGGQNLSLSLAHLASFESFSIHKLMIVALPLGILYWLGVGAAWQQP